jgi:predicted RNA-binding Zn ribbon-like protein
MTMPSWVAPDEAKPAPMPLLLVQAFVNTWDADHGTDLLADGERAGGWLREAGLLRGTAALSPGELRRAREVREEIRALLARNGTGLSPAPAELHAVDGLAAGARFRLSVDPSGQLHLGAAGGGVDGALSELLLVIRDAQQAGTWHRLKACRNPDCQWAFYDRSHSQRGTWCDMSACGNRIKNRNLRRRRGAAPAPGAAGVAL